MSTSPYSGILHCSNPSNSPERLPLEEVNVQALIIDLSARITLTQRYYNPSDKPTPRAKYVFPVPASAAICAFELHTSDGRIVTAVSKDMQVAAQEHEQAVQQSKATVLLEMVTDDLFTISVGSIPARQTVKTKLVYVMTLMANDLADVIRFFLPMHVAERYGPPPAALQQSSTPSHKTKLRIQVDIQTSGKVQMITSPSHNSQDHLTIEAYATHLKRPSRRRYKVKFRSDTFLDRDFILLVQANGLDAPRCFAEMRAQDNGSYSLAMQLIIVPKSVLPAISSQEYIFLLDRSGSMQGNSIETAKKTLLMLLRLLPESGTFFNMFGFGSTVENYWHKSQSYSQNSMENMSTFIRTIRADLGGTEIRQALDAVFQSRLRNVPTAVFVLTDGEVTDINGTVSLVQSQVAKSPISAPLRVFTVGIGEGVSTALCESVARVGKGVFFYAREAEFILAGCARQLRAGRTPMIENVTVDWGVPDTTLLSNSSVNFSDQLPSVRLKPPPAIQQSPPIIATSIHSGTRTDVHAILSLKNQHAPEQVILRGQLDSDGSVFEHKVKIRGIELADSDHGVPLVHTLAAWKLIQDHQEDRAPLPEAVGGTLDHPSLRRAAIVRLGTTYQLASRFTSFVAVDNSLPSQSRNRFFSHRWSTGIYNRLGRDNSPGRGGDTSRRNSIPFPSSDPTRYERSSTYIPGGWLDSPLEPTPDGEEQDNASDYSTQTFTSLSSLISYSDWSDSSDSEAEAILPDTSGITRSPSPTFEPSTTTVNRVQFKGEPPAWVTPTLITDLICLQSFDGSFKLNPDFEKLAGDAARIDPSTLGTSGETWATAVAVALMEKHLKDNQELLGDLLVKAMEFLGKEPNFEKILKKAKGLV
ncbi:hypothetical protein K435DRAFT_684502 [Dendrothele bispora CBS 962.96]|uniref:VIT-domain-containing protein n=1 Tax=Dendrothele bispora (strain CBS 962.96) TaxID=1314807 RepID=A0A4S8LBJ3_DENBC|nr:hypothetical protein K435DRAFT_684502 [Dendrothele bispora CBS 962.96]